MTWTRITVLYFSVPMVAMLTFVFDFSSWVQNTVTANHFPHKRNKPSGGSVVFCNLQLQSRTLSKFRVSMSIIS